MPETTETLSNKKLEANQIVNEAIDSFLEEKELSVTITLFEYRDLLFNKAVAKYQIEQAEKELRERNSENEKLKARVKELENRLFEYRKKFGDLEQESEE